MTHATSDLSVTVIGQNRPCTVFESDAGESVLFGASEAALDRLQDGRLDVDHFVPADFAASDGEHDAVRAAAAVAADATVHLPEFDEPDGPVEKWIADHSRKFEQEICDRNGLDVERHASDDPLRLGPATTVTQMDGNRAVVCRHGDRDVLATRDALTPKRRMAYHDTHCDGDGCDADPVTYCDGVGDGPDVRVQGTTGLAAAEKFGRSCAGAEAVVVTGETVSPGALDAIAETDADVAVGDARTVTTPVSMTLARDERRTTVDHDLPPVAEVRREEDASLTDSIGSKLNRQEGPERSDAERER